MDTIYALSSGSLPCAIAIIRLSGPQVKLVLQSIVGLVPPARLMHYAVFKNQHQEILDYGMCAYFPGPHSFTGEDCAEFYLHGSKAVVATFFTALSNFEKTRLAQAGEFSRRAFLNGKIDLVQAESLADLLEAETESQHRLSILGASRQTTQLYEGWRKLLLRSMAFVEAELDFSSEEDVASLDNKYAWQIIDELIAHLEQHLSMVKTGHIMQNGLKIVLTGPPNAGKSSLINKLCGRDLAIVTPQAGTTRDIIEGRLLLHGIDIFLFDTAGLRQPSDEIEQIGIDKALDYIKQADLLFYLHDASSDAPPELPDSGVPIWFINNKMDQAGANPLSPENCEKMFCISTIQGIGLSELQANISNYLVEYLPKYGTIIPAKQRHIELLQNSLKDLKLAMAQKSIDTEISAEYLRMAANNLGKITGQIGVENILDVVFSQFCIGK